MCKQTRLQEANQPQTMQPSDHPSAEATEQLVLFLTVSERRSIERLAAVWNRPESDAVQRLIGAALRQLFETASESGDQCADCPVSRLGRAVDERQGGQS